MQIWSESSELVAGNQIGVSVQRFLELQGGKHCKWEISGERLF